MSTVIDPKADTESEIQRQLDEITEPHTKSRQAKGDVSSNAHNDGEDIHRQFNQPPLHKYLAKAARHGNSVANWPGAFVDNIVYTDDRDLELLRQLAFEDEHEVDYDFRDPEPSHPALERYHPQRAKLMEWIADDPRRVKHVTSVKGTDMWMHGEPGGGKTTLAESVAMWRQQVNNETFIWAESVDESGTNERTEWLPYAPWTTIAVPSELGVEVRIVPESPMVDAFKVPLESIARDVIYYDSIQDLMKQLFPGQFYVVFPDPLHRGCDTVSKYNYFNFNEVTPKGERGPNQTTDADQWWFAFIAHRISGDVFTHPTFLNLDEAGNLLDPDARKDIHQHYQKIVWFRNKYADARKKGLSFGYQTHALGEMHKFARAKIRWRVTMNGNSPPIGQTLPGGRRCPMEVDQTSSMGPGNAQIWKAPHFANIKWPNIKGRVRLDAEVSIDFTRWQSAVGGA